MKWISTLTILLSLLCATANAQLTQRIRGTVTDNILQTPLAGATVSIQGTHFKTVADSAGHFIIAQVPVGVYSLQASYVGYRNGVLNNVEVITGKELVVNMAMELAVANEDNVFVKGRSKKNRPINDRSLVSARAFTVEETQKYAAAVNDPLRMATAFAGVVSADDGNNNIVIRGNAPSGLLWRMEGIDIPNPNHFGNTNSSGGGISILSSALLSNSDFVTGAWASEYGNALSGAFDLKLRKGNNQKHEYILQAGLLGLNAAAEGPMNIGGNKGSYLVNYRYSTLSLLKTMGMDVGVGNTNFQDLSYNLHLPTKRAGSFTLFGFGGLSSQSADAETDSSTWEGEGDRYGFEYTGKTMFNGATHQIQVGRKAMLKSAIGYSIFDGGYAETYTDDDLKNNLNFKTNSITKKVTLTTTLNQRIDNRNSIRTGAIVNLIDYSFFEQSKQNLNAPLEKVLDSRGKTQTIQAFSEWQTKPFARLTINAGMHYLTLLSNNTSSIEPRVAAKWDASRTGSFTLGYGLHSQIQGLGVYFAERKNAEGQLYMPNKDLGFTRAHHFVVGFNQQLGTNYRIKTELYYQHLFDVPVGNSDTSTLSALNIQDGYITEAMVNQGKGRNYGIEVSLERSLEKNFYLLWSNSIYQSKYTALDGIERNTRWNGNYASTLVIGKDFVGKQGRRTFGVNLKTVAAGGFRQTPVDLEKSREEGYGVYKDKEAFTNQLPGYFRTDLRLSIKWNRPRHTSTLSLDLQNMTNRQNVFGYYYDPRKQDMTTAYQTGLIPVLNYKVEL